MIAPVLEEIGGVLVVRDDLVAGGTKRAVLDELLPSWPEHELVYASPADGYAQLALALAGASAGRRVSIWVARRAVRSPETRGAHRAGAELHEVTRGSGRFSVVRHDARVYAERVGARALPTGFDSDEFRDAIAARARMLDVKPERVVAVVGTGTLIRGLQLAWPDAEFVAVKVGMRPQIGGAQLVEAPERYAQRAQQPPPFPSAAHYDAKAWRYTRGEQRTLFWNVAG